MPIYRVWEHIDTGIEVTVTAKNKNEAITKAYKKIMNLPNAVWRKQLADNAQSGDMDVIETIGRVS